MFQTTHFTLLGIAVRNRNNIYIYFLRNTATHSFMFSYDLLVMIWLKKKVLPHVPMRFLSLLQIKEYFLFIPH